MEGSGNYRNRINASFRAREIAGNIKKGRCAESSVRFSLPAFRRLIEEEERSYRRSALLTRGTADGEKIRFTAAGGGLPGPDCPPQKSRELSGG
jgi:hypothetical protein